MGLLFVSVIVTADSKRDTVRW